MRKRKADLKVLFLSGHVGSEVLKFYGLKPSTLHFFGKPFKSADLLERVTEVLSSPEYPKVRWKTKAENDENAENGNGDSGK